jgi:hypothetical protein
MPIRPSEIAAAKIWAKPGEQSPGEAFLPVLQGKTGPENLFEKAFEQRRHGSMPERKQEHPVHGGAARGTCALIYRKKIRIFLGPEWQQTLAPHRCDHGHAGIALSLVFGAYGLRAFERSMLSFAGIKPVRESLFGLSFADERKRARWIEGIRRRGGRGD